MLISTDGLARALICLFYYSICFSLQMSGKEAMLCKACTIIGRLAAGLLVIPFHVNTGLFETIVSVLTTCHTQDT
jgi:hypothetical protein